MKSKSAFASSSLNAFKPGYAAPGVAAAILRWVAYRDFTSCPCPCACPDPLLSLRRLLDETAGRGGGANGYDLMTSKSEGVAWTSSGGKGIRRTV
jgi:hypothetical protein